MFNLFKKKNEHERLVSPDLYAICDGTILKMEDVKDPVFSQKMIGDGFAIALSGNEIVAPHDAVVTVLFPTNHAFGLTFQDGMEILVHIGIDTVSENGKGFQCHVKQNTKVQTGDPIVTIDKAYLESRGYDLTTMIIFTKPEAYQHFTCAYGKQVHAGLDVVATYNQ